MDLSDKLKGSYSVNLRTLTRKSILGFGYQEIKNIRIQDLLISNKQKELIKIYYGLDKISFLDDILEECGITKEMRIEKPGKIVDYDKRDELVAIAMENVKIYRQKERAAFRKMMEEKLDSN
ncbi:MAG: hypothetical protein K0B10_02505 [Vicingaceae bacterium]|nr:hypothetical protein [Vicingaceae bacterium]